MPFFVPHMTEFDILVPPIFAIVISWYRASGPSEESEPISVMLSHRLQDYFSCNVT